MALFSRRGAQRIIKATVSEERRLRGGVAPRVRGNTWLPGGLIAASPAAGIPAATWDGTNLVAGQADCLILVQNTLGWTKTGATRTQRVWNTAGAIGGNLPLQLKRCQGRYLVDVEPCDIKSGGTPPVGQGPIATGLGTTANEARPREAADRDRGRGAVGFARRLAPTGTGTGVGGSPSVPTPPPPPP